MIKDKGHYDLMGFIAQGFILIIFIKEIIFYLLVSCYQAYANTTGRICIKIRGGS